MYLANYIMPQNGQLLEDTKKFVCNVNKKKYKIEELSKCLMSWIVNDRSPIGVLFVLWMSFLEYEMREKTSVHNFLTE